jgi:sortase A
VKRLIRFPPLSLAQTQHLVRRVGNLLCIGGLIALAYVGFALLDARLYQASAKHSLETQARIRKDAGVSPLAPPAPIAKDGDVLGRIDIPRLGLSVAILEGTKSQILRLGAGHIEGTALPGDVGNTGIAAHRDTFFRPVQDIRRNDEILLQTTTGRFRYEVDWVKIVPPEDVSVLTPSTDSTLTLVTCYPFHFVGAAPLRFIVRAHQDSSPVAQKDRQITPLNP